MKERGQGRTPNPNSTPAKAAAPGSLMSDRAVYLALGSGCHIGSASWLGGTY